MLRRGRPLRRIPHTRIPHYIALLHCVLEIMIPRTSPEKARKNPSRILRIFVALLAVEHNLKSETINTVAVAGVFYALRFVLEEPVVAVGWYKLFPWPVLNCVHGGGEEGVLVLVEDWARLGAVCRHSVAMMLHGISLAVPHGGLCANYEAPGGSFGFCRRRDGGIGSVSHFGGFSRWVSCRRDCSPWVGNTFLANSGGNLITVLGFGGRRHNRRREPLGGGVSGRKPRGDDKVEITLDFEHLKQTAGEAAVTTKRALVSSVSNARQACASFVEDGKQAWNELRYSVALQSDKRVVIAVKRSTLEFAGRTLIWTVLTIVFARVVVAWARRFRWGWEEGFSWPRTVRDRSLGGKEVVVKSGIQLWEGGPPKKAFRKAAQGLSPLDSVKTDTRSEKELRRLKGSSDPSTFKKVQRESRLPPWWPAPEQAPTLPPETTADAQREANTLLNDMLERRMNGIDFEHHNIIKLRGLCRNYGTRISFETANTRDAFYRTAVQLVHNVCVRGGEFPDEGVAKFIAGLAGNIGLDAEKAAVMVIASVAARTRATFLQTWALYERGQIEAAHTELEGLVRIHENFSPVRNSPEMEMAARGLTYLPVEDRRVLLEMYIFSGGRNTEWLAKEALSLM